MEPPERPSKAYDATIAAFNAAGALAPPAGVAAAVISQRVQAVINDRLYQFLEDFVREYNERDLVSEVLDSEDFVNAAVFAARAAQTTSEAAKLDALRKCLLSALLPGAPSRDEQAHFMRLVDRFSGTHLLVLDHLADPNRRYPNGLPVGAGSTRRRLLEQTFPILEGRSEWLDLVWSDLHNGRLVTTGPEQAMTMMTSGGVRAGIATPLGLRFLRFIRAEQQDASPSEP